jgi:hypothetical protein
MLAEETLVDDRRAMGERSGPRSIELSDGNIRVWCPPDGGKLRNELIFRYETLRLTRKLREDERFARDGLRLRRQRVPRERHHEQCGRGPGHGCCLTKCLPKLRARTCEVPDAMGDDQVEAIASRGDADHRSECQMQAAGELLNLNALVSGREHSPREVYAEDVPAHQGQRDGIAAGTAAEVERVSGPPKPCQLGLGEFHQRCVWQRPREAGNGSGFAPRRSFKRVRHHCAAIRHCSFCRPAQCCIGGVIAVMVPFFDSATI